MRINIWSSPRNVSTAFMYAFAQRVDTTVVDEPLYAHYLSKTDTEAKHPATEEVLRTQNPDGQQVIEQMLYGHFDTPVVLFKQMTHHLIQLDWSFMQHTRNVLLIRDPRAIISSYARVIPNPQIQDVGVALQTELYNYLSAHNCLTAIVDAAELLKNPERVLTQLCTVLGLEFSESMLRWEPGPKPYDGVWAPYWYHQVHASAGFQAAERKDYVVPEYLEPLAAACQPHYDRLMDFAIKA